MKLNFDLDFKRNLSDKERVIRSSIGGLLLGLVLSKGIKGFWAVVSVIFAICLFLDSLFSYCVLYDLLDKKCKKC